MKTIIRTERSPQEQRIDLAEEYASSLERKIVEYASMWGDDAMLVALSRQERVWLRAWRAVQG